MEDAGLGRLFSLHGLSIPVLFDGELYVVSNFLSLFCPEWYVDKTKQKTNKKGDMYERCSLLKNFDSHTHCAKLAWN